MELLRFFMVRNYKFLASLLMMSFFFGCANLASNQKACESADFLLPLPLSFLGNVFQISPCTSIESLRIETGDEIRRQRYPVVSAVKSKQLNYDFELFAYKMGCDKTVHGHLLKILVENQDIVFGSDFQKSNREIVKQVRSFTRSDSELLKNCW